MTPGALLQNISKHTKFYNGPHRGWAHKLCTLSAVHAWPHVPTVTKAAITGMQKSQSLLTLFLVWTVRFHISSALSLLLLPKKQCTPMPAPPDVCSLSCKYYLEAIIVINEHNHPKSGGISFNASLCSIPYVPGWKERSREREDLLWEDECCNKDCSSRLAKGLLVWDFFVFWQHIFSPRTQYTRSVFARMGYCFLFICWLLRIHPSPSSRAMPTCLGVISCKWEGNQAAFILISPLGSVVFVFGPQLSDHLPPFCCFTTEVTEVESVGHFGFAGTVHLARIVLIQWKELVYQKSRGFRYKLGFSTKKGQMKNRREQGRGKIRRRGGEGGERKKGEGSEELLAPLASVSIAPDRLNSPGFTFPKPDKLIPLSSSVPLRCYARLISHVPTFGSVFKSLIHNKFLSPLEWRDLFLKPYYSYWLNGNLTCLPLPLPAFPFLSNYYTFSEFPAAVRDVRKFSWLLASMIWLTWLPLSNGQHNRMFLHVSTASLSP